MFDEKVILTRLQNGESVEAIAKELTSVLNTANHKYEASKRAAEEAKRKRDASKRSELKALVQMAGKWYNDYIATTEEEKVAINEALNEADIEEMIELFENLHELFISLNWAIEPTIQKKKETKPKQNTDDVISDFLSQMGW